LPYLTWDSARKKSPGTLGRCRPGSNLRGSTTIRKPAATLRLCLAQKGAQIGRNLQYAPMVIMWACTVDKRALRLWDKPPSGGKYPRIGARTRELPGHLPVSTGHVKKPDLLCI
jgi:hypothetical protein